MGEQGFHDLPQQKGGLSTPSRSMVGGLEITAGQLVVDDIKCEASARLDLNGERVISEPRALVNLLIGLRCRGCGGLV